MYWVWLCDAHTLGGARTSALPHMTHALRVASSARSFSIVPWTLFQPWTLYWPWTPWSMHLKLVTCIFRNVQKIWTGLSRRFQSPIFQCTHPRKSNPLCPYDPLGPCFRALNLGPFWPKFDMFSTFPPSKNIISPQKGSKNATFWNYS